MHYFGEIPKNNYCQARKLYNIFLFFFFAWTKLLHFYLTLFIQALQEYEELVSRPADDSNLAFGKDVSDTVDFDAMEDIE